MIRRCFGGVYSSLRTYCEVIYMDDQELLWTFWVILFLAYLFFGTLYYVSPMAAGITGFVVAVAFLKELIWGNKN